MKLDPFVKLAKIATLSASAISFLLIQSVATAQDNSAAAHPEAGEDHAAMHEAHHGGDGDADHAAMHEAHHGDAGVAHGSTGGEAHGTTGGTAHGDTGATHETAGAAHGAGGVSPH